MSNSTNEEDSGAMGTHIFAIAVDDPSVEVLCRNPVNLGHEEHLGEKQQVRSHEHHTDRSTCQDHMVRVPFSQWSQRRSASSYAGPRGA